MVRPRIPTAIAAAVLRASAARRGTPANPNGSFTFAQTSLTADAPIGAVAGQLSAAAPSN